MRRAQACASRPQRRSCGRWRSQAQARQRAPGAPPESPRHAAAGSTSRSRGRALLLLGAGRSASAVEMRMGQRIAAGTGPGAGRLRVVLEVYAGNRAVRAAHHVARKGLAQAFADGHARRPASAGPGATAPARRWGPAATAASISSPATAGPARCPRSRIKRRHRRRPAPAAAQAQRAQGAQASELGGNRRAPAQVGHGRSTGRRRTPAAAPSRR